MQWRTSTARRGDFSRHVLLSALATKPVEQGDPALTSQVEAEGDVATAFTLARILSNIPLSRGGPTSVVIFDIHALQVGGLCLPDCIPCLFGPPVKANSGVRTSCGRQSTLAMRPLCDCAQERFYFGDTVLPLFESGIPLLRKRLAKLADRDNITIAYPDEGAWKRFKYQFDEYPEVGSSDTFCRHLTHMADRACQRHAAAGQVMSVQ